MSIFSFITGRFTVSSHGEAQQKGLKFERWETGRTFFGRPWVRPHYVGYENGAILPYQGPRLIDMSGKVGAEYYKRSWLATGTDPQSS
jgi:hypothetical protein